MPLLGALQDRGFKVALAADGRTSGAMATVSTGSTRPKRREGEPLAKVRNGDLLRVDGEWGVDVLAGGLAERATGAA